MNDVSRNKLSRLLIKYPELKDTLLSLEDEKIRGKLNKILSKPCTKYIVVGRSYEELVNLIEMGILMKRGYLHITRTSTVELLDAYVGDDEDSKYMSLSQVVDGLVIIEDCRAFVPNKQKSNMVMQVFEQNKNVIYFYKGSETSFNAEHAELKIYAKEENILMLTADRKKKE